MRCRRHRRRLGRRVWRRDFEHGVVLVHPMSTTRTITLKSGFATASRQAGSRGERRLRCQANYLAVEGRYRARRRSMPDFGGQPIARAKSAALAHHRRSRSGPTPLPPARRPDRGFVNGPLSPTACLCTIRTWPSGTCREAVICPESCSRPPLACQSAALHDASPGVVSPATRGLHHAERPVGLVRR